MAAEGHAARAVELVDGFVATTRTPQGVRPRQMKLPPPRRYIEFSIVIKPARQLDRTEFKFLERFVPMGRVEYRRFSFKANERSRLVGDEIAEET